MSKYIQSHLHLVEWASCSLPGSTLTISCMIFIGVVFSQAVERFNANVGYSGLNHAVTQEVCESSSCEECL